MFTVTMINFNMTIYQGNDAAAANQAAVKSGFECSVYNSETGRVTSYSPIGGWRII